MTAYLGYGVIRVLVSDLEESMGEAGTSARWQSLGNVLVHSEDPLLFSTRCSTENLHRSTGSWRLPLAPGVCHPGGNRGLFYLRHQLSQRINHRSITACHQYQVYQRGGIERIRPSYLSAPGHRKMRMGLVDPNLPP